MKFLKGLLIFIFAPPAIGVLVAYTFPYGLVVLLGALAVAAVAFIKPLPVAGLRTRGWSSLWCVCLLLALIGASVSGKPTVDQFAEEASDLAKEAPKNETPPKQETKATMTYTEKDFYWDKYTTPYKEVLIAGVNKVARENSRCASLDPGSASKSGSKGTTANPVFFVMCKDAGGNVFNAFFSKADVEADISLAAVQHVNRDSAVDACEDHAKNNAQHPGTVDFSRLLDLQIYETPNGNTRVSSSFTAKNGFGLELKYNISCLMNANGLFEATIHEARG